MVALVRSPQTVAFFKAKYETSSPLDEAAARRWIRLLDSNSSAERDVAERELRQLGFRVHELLNQALQASPASEARQRIHRLLTPAADTYHMRDIRAIAVLETLGDPAAPNVLKLVARGKHPTAVAIEACTALERLYPTNRDR